MSANFGIDLIFETQRGNIQGENDVLIVLIHWILCKNDFRNVGIGDNVSRIMSYYKQLIKF